MREGVRKKLEDMEARAEELEKQISDPEVISNPARYRIAAREHGSDAIAYLPSGHYKIQKTLVITGENYRVGGSGFRTALVWGGPEDGTMIEVRDPGNITLEHIAVGNHDAGQMNNAIGTSRN